MADTAPRAGLAVSFPLGPAHPDLGERLDDLAGAVRRLHPPAPAAVTANPGSFQAPAEGGQPFDFKYLKAWIASRAPGGADGGGGREMREEFEQFFTHIFNKSRDGISILALDLTIVGVNTTIRNWYAPGRALVGRKCFEAYHGRDAPCDSCPSLVTHRTGRAQVGVVPYQVSGCVKGDQELSVFPLFDDNRQMFGVLEFVRDITSLEPDARIVENLKRRVQFQDQTLQEQETALAVLLRQGHNVEQRVSQEIAANIDTLVMPLVARLKATCAGTAAARDVALLQERLCAIASTHSSRLSRALRGLTCREQEVASLVRQGRTSKEIAEQLCVSTKAVEFHRTNIRKKVGAERSAGSLRSLLLDREHP